MNSLPVLTEAQEADILVAWLRVHGYKFTHIGNETGSSPEAMRRAVRLKRQGVSKGFPDYLIIAGGHIIFIELKSKRGYASPEQKAWIEAINEIDNVEGFICRGAEAAIKVIEELVPHSLGFKNIYHKGKPVTPVF